MNKDKTLETAKKIIGNTGEKLYKRYDLQDESNFEIETLEQMKEWLVNFWNNNPDNDMNDKEHEELIEKIMNSNEDEMFERLECIDYSYFELDENGNEIIPEATSILTNLSWGYSVRSEKINNSFVQMFLYRNKKLSESFIVMLEKWNDEHDKYVNILLKELKDFKTTEPRVRIIE